MKNLEYYTELPLLPFKDYGRNVLSLIEKIKEIPDKQQRNYYAHQVIKSMSAVNPAQKDMADYKKKLWHHFFVLAGHSIDVDCPYDFSELEKPIEESPHEKLTYQSSKPKMKQYGKNIEILIEKIVELPDGEEKNHQVQSLANLMKICAQKSNDEKIEDATIFEHLSQLSNGKLILNKEEVTLQAVTFTKNKPQEKNKRKFNKNNPKQNQKNKKFFYNKNKK